MIPVKIQCGCGQRYAFEVEPVGGRVPSPVTCPACGADGTAAANAVIAQSAAAQPAPAAARRAPLRVATPSNDPATSAASSPNTVRRGATLLPGQVDRTQAEHEARAKVLWGDPPQVVTAYLITQGFSRPEAASLVEELFQERAATIRGNGIKKIVLGIAMMFVPVVAVFIFLSVGLIHWGIFAATIIAGFWGVWTLIGGIRMVVTPKAVEGDAAEQ